MMKDMYGKSSLTMQVPFVIRWHPSLSETKSVVFWGHIYADIPVYQTAIFDPKVGKIWARKFADLREVTNPDGSLPVEKWFVEYEETNGPLLSTRELDRFLEHRYSLSRPQKEFLINEYSTHHDFYTDNAYFNPVA